MGSAGGARRRSEKESIKTHTSHSRSDCSSSFDSVSPLSAIAVSWKVEIRSRNVQENREGVHRHKYARLWLSPYEGRHTARVLQSMYDDKIKGGEVKEGQTPS